MAKKTINARSRKSKARPRKPAQGQAGDEWAQNYSAAAKASGLKQATIKALKDNGSKAFPRNGRINITILKRDAIDMSSLVSTTESLPDFTYEKASGAKLKNTLLEIEVQKQLENIAPLDICRRIMTRGGSMARTKLMVIPERVSELFSLETDALKIRERLVKELSDALRSVSEESVEILIKEILEGK